MIHINIASLSKHIDELRSFICTLNHPFDVIGITETRLYDDNPLENIEIDGYEFRHKPTGTQCGGAGIYIKACYAFDVKHEISKSIPNITETVFVELKIAGHKSLLIGCIYRHTPISTFADTYFKKMLELISKQSNKICGLMGDFNVDLIKYASNTNTGYFYDLLCSYCFRPFILQPTRVMSNTATLIDNIFINDMACHSDGGNLTLSISNHFSSFVKQISVKLLGIKGVQRLQKILKHLTNVNLGKKCLILTGQM